MSDRKQSVGELSEAAQDLCAGWFLFGSKATVNISPPHANLKANKQALDELVERGIISHEHEEWRDIHTYRGTEEARRIGQQAARRLLKDDLQ